MTMTLSVIGETFLDRDIEGTVSRVAPDAPVPVLDEIRSVVRPGAAAHTAMWIARDVGDRRTELITALAQDEPAYLVRSLLESEGVRIVDIGWIGSTPEKVRFRGNGQVLLRHDRGTAGGQVREQLPEDALQSASIVVVSDYGRGLTQAPEIRAALKKRAIDAPVIWDPHVRGGLPVENTTTVTANIRELAFFAGRDFGHDMDSIKLAAVDMLSDWRVESLVVTMGERGALLVDRHQSLVFPAPKVEVIDTCGAGDRFVASLACRLVAGCDMASAVEASVVAAANYVASEPAARLVVPRVQPRAVDELESIAGVVEDYRRSGFKVVATSGCFDIIHPGHVRFLEEARQLGDFLVVLLNSDDSVRRLKGPRRPVTPAHDRAAVLKSIAAVDAVVVFSELTPAESLKALRPTTFVKGGDYSIDELPELEVLRAIEADIRILRYWPGYSTSRLVEAMLG